MQNIEAILKQFGLEVPKEQSEDFRKVFHENYKTVKDYEKVESDQISHYRFSLLPPWSKLPSLTKITTTTF